MAASLVPTDGGSPIALDKPITLIGRHQECDVSLQESSKVSRRHCCVVQCGERYVLRDLGSMNGIRVNGHRLVETELRGGDEVAVADVLFTFTVDAPPQKRSEAVQRAAPLELAPPVARPPAPAEVNSQIPLAVPEETESPADDDSGGPERTYENQILRNRGVELRQKDDSHSQPEFVQV